MDLPKDFYRLPLRFDAERLQREVSEIDESRWIAHPSGFPGNSALQLVSVEGELNNDRLQGPQHATVNLDECVYLQQVLASFDTAIGRTRLMRLAPGADAKAHMDASYYWHQRLRIHVPICTHPDIAFYSGDSRVHMAAGECWVFNTWKMHSVVNDTDRARIHLVCDTVGSPALWDLLEQAETVPRSSDGQLTVPRKVNFRAGWQPQLTFEAVNFPAVMSPWEQESLLRPIMSELRVQFPERLQMRAQLEAAVQRFERQWKNSWAQFGDTEAGWSSYRSALASLVAALEPLQGEFVLNNAMDAVGMIRKAVVEPALNHDQVSTLQCTAPVTTAERVDSRSGLVARFHQPVFIVAAPRSGSSFLFEQLATSRELYTLGGEGHGVFEGVAKLRPQNRLYESNVLGAEDADQTTCEQLYLSLLRQVCTPDGRRPDTRSSIRLLEKTPKNALRIPFLNQLFPDALFVYLYREPAASLASIAEAWESGRFVTYPDLPDWQGPPWSLLLTPQWRELPADDIYAIALQQWHSANRQIQDDLQCIDDDRWMALSYEELVARPNTTLQRIARFAGFHLPKVDEGSLPLSRHTVTAPEPDKWRARAEFISPLLSDTSALHERASGMIASSEARAYPARGTESPHLDPEVSPLRSSHTSNFTELLNAIDSSLMVTTYQAGKLVVVRPAAAGLNTHFSNFPRPMGLAVGGDKLAVGTRNAIELYGRLPADNGMASEAFYRRLEYVTGNIDVHEMAWSNSGLWFINTRFSCLCSLDAGSSFVPRWQPPFVTALVPEDRCHLNGLCVVDDVPRFVTALGASDSKSGWRANRASGGVVIDVQDNAIVTDGLSMPHSPRWHRGQLWVLESGKGSLARIDHRTGAISTVAELPGFTRGLAFAGNLAFVGLSQVRESAAFGSIPITERAAERICGVWVVDIDTGSTVAWLRFDGDVNEIFALELARGLRSPSIVQSHESALDNTFFTASGALQAH